jgi:hypothetical protein
MDLMAGVYQAFFAEPIDFFRVKSKQKPARI